MLTYTPPSSKQAAKTREKPWLLLLMVFAWLWPGVFSHGLWNPAEPAAFTAIEALRHGAPTLWADVLGEADFNIAPVYLWAAAAFQQLLSPWAADAYSAARFASVFFTALGLTCCGFAGFNFLGRHHGRSVVLILAGCVGLLPMAHFLGGMSVVFAALSLILCGFSLAHKKVIAAAPLLGGGWALLSLSGGLLLTAAFVLLALLLPLSRKWRFKRYLLTLVGAFAVGLPLTVVYPLVLYRLHPDMFALWLHTRSLGAFGGTATFQTAFNLPYYLKNLLWFAFPAWPLAVWTFTRTRVAAQAWSVLAAAWLAVCGILLAASPEAFQDHLLWLLPPLALLGAAQLDGLRRGAAAFLNWFGSMAFGLLAVFLWIGFFAANYGWPAKLAERAAYFSPYYTPDIDPMPMIVAISFTPLWLWAITRKNIRGRQAVTNWAAGVTLVWALLMTLFLPWLDAAKSHAPVVRLMEQSLPPEAVQRLSDGQDCISVAQNHRRARIAWAQYSRFTLQPDNNSCRYLLVQQPKDTAAPQGWTKIWQGWRPRNQEQGYALLEKSG